MTEAAQQKNLPAFSIDKIYVKDLSLEIPHAPGIFLERDNLQVDVQLHTQAGSIQDNVYEVVVMATVTARIGEKVMFLIETKQAGIFHISNVPTEELELILAVMCPNILFPYLRAEISDISVRGGFAPVLLTPFNFEELYQQQKHQTLTTAPTTPQ
jgi:preprotein translocase subunit SecB